MKAAFFNKNGGPEVMEYGELPDPVTQTNPGAVRAPPPSAMKRSRKLTASTVSQRRLSLCARAAARRGGIVSRLCAACARACCARA